MGKVIKFERPARPRSASQRETNVRKDDGPMGEILFFTGIRIERHDTATDCHEVAAGGAVRVRVCERLAD